MWQGDDCCTSQTALPTVSCSGEIRDREQSAYSANRELIILAQSGEGECSERALEELIKLNMGLVRKIALRFCDRGVELEDLIQIGTIGMIKAVRGFDSTRGTNFSTYAVPLIFGEIRRHLRDEGPIKVGRYYKKLGALLLSEKNRIFAQEGREAHISELASVCGVTAEEASFAMDAISPIVSLSDSAYGEEDNVTVGETIIDVEASSEISRINDRVALQKACSEMSEQWQQIVALRFFRNMTQQQVADILGVTQVKVSREEKKILAFLRERLI